MINYDRLPINESIPLDLPSRSRAWDTVSVESLSVDHAYSVPEEVFARHTVTIQIAGECHITHRNSKFLQTETVFPGSISVLPAGLQYGGYTSESEKVINIHLDRSLVERVAGDEFGTRDIEIVPQFNRFDSQIFYIGAALQAHLAAGSETGRLFGESLGVALAAHLLKNYCSKEMLAREYAGGLPKYKLRRATERINDCLGEDLTLAELADGAGMSVYYFARLFKQSTGKTPQQYIIEQKINRAKQLLLETDSAVTEIAYRLGFATPSHFTMLFKRLTGATPTAFRKSL